MNIRWTITEKTIASILIVLACLQLYSGLSTLKFMLDISFSLGQLTWDKISLTKIFKNYHLQTLLGLVTISGATLLLFNKKLGWILSAAVAVIQAINIILMLVIYKGSNYKKEGFSFVYLLVGLIILFYLAAATLLVQKPFRNKYSPTNKSWLSILVLVLIFFIDKIIFK